MSSASVRRNTCFELQPDWPILQSQSLSRSYGSALPTSLTYIILETRGYSPWRPAADIGTAQGKGKVFAIEFSRADGSAPDPARTAGLFGVNIHISRQAVFMESTPYREKTTLPGTTADVFDFDCVAASATEVAPSASEFGNINPMPFREVVHRIKQSI